LVMHTYILTRYKLATLTSLFEPNLMENVLHYLIIKIWGFTRIVSSSFEKIVLPNLKNESKARIVFVLNSLSHSNLNPRIG